jgi:predicted KAP-like P-loop ATPase
MDFNRNLSTFLENIHKRNFSLNQNEKGLSSLSMQAIMLAHKNHQKVHTLTELIGGGTKTSQVIAESFKDACFCLE